MRRAITFLLALGLTLGAAKASAQLIAAKDGPVVYGHHHLNVTSIADHEKFWVAGLGGVAVASGSVTTIKFPNLLVMLRQQAPTGGTKGTTVNHFGFLVPNIRNTVERLRAAGYPIVTKDETRFPEKEGVAFVADLKSSIAFVMGPDNIKVELVEDPAVSTAFPIQLHHIHFFTPDVIKMRDWYATMFGAKPGKRGTFEAADLPGVNLTFVPSPDPVVGTAGRTIDHIGFEVRDLAAFCKKLESMGVTFQRPYARSAELKIATALFTDPWGTAIELTEGLDKYEMPYRWAILGFAILAYGTSQFARQNFSGIQKFIAADLNLDKGSLGLLASVFFYSYALFQMPWGIAADRFSSRFVVGLGILLIAGTMAGFATGQTEGSLLFWRCAGGVAGAAVYVALTGNIARWFPAGERGLSQATLGGVGGALGESVAYFLLPVLSIYFATGWRQGMNMVAAAIAVVGVVCVIFLRNAPQGQPATTRQPFDWKLLRDMRLWCYAFIYCGFVVGIRTTQTWMAVYAADVYVAEYGYAVNQAVVAGGLLALVAYSLVGRAIGCPLAGRLSDVLAARGVSRTVVLIGWLLCGLMTLQILSLGVTSLVPLAIVIAILGTSVNLFSLVPAAISETYGAQRTASISSFANTLGQLAGATALAISGYAGISLNTQPGNALTEYRGVWLSGMVGMSVMTTLGVAAYLALRTGWTGRLAIPSVSEEAGP